MRAEKKEAFAGLTKARARSLILRECARMVGVYAVFAPD